MMDLLSEIRSKRAILESQIRTLVLDFEQHTGCRVNTIEIPHVENTGFGSEKREWVLGQIEIPIDIGDDL